jgi:serine/threonine protein phosphatase 1
MWIIGDIHGCAAELDELLSRIPAEDKLLFVGDYIDRGPDSRAVLDRMIGLAPRSIFLLGNHESMMWSYFQAPGSEEAHSWLHPLNGGLATLKSYGLSRGCGFADIPAAHRLFLESLRPFYDGPDFIAVHAGLDVNEPDLRKQAREDLIWIRERWIRHEAEWRGKFVYFGHTPSRYVLGYGKDSSLIEGRNSLGLDTGCVFGGVLTAVHHPDRRVIQVPARQAYV